MATKRLEARGAADADDATTGQQQDGDECNRATRDEGDVLVDLLNAEVLPLIQSSLSIDEQDALVPALVPLAMWYQCRPKLTDIVAKKRGRYDQDTAVTLLSYVYFWALARNRIRPSVTVKNGCTGIVINDGVRQLHQLLPTALQRLERAVLGRDGAFAR